MKSKSSNKSLITKWVLLVVVLIAAGAGGYLCYKYYQDYRANKVYSVGETVSFPDLKIDITKTEFKPVDLPLDKKSIAKYGDLEKREDCDSMSKEQTWNFESYRSTGWMQYGPSDYNICVRRNNSRDEISKYTNENKQLVIDYKITAADNINTSKLRLELIPDSGRELGQQVNMFNANQFFENSAQRKIQIEGAPGPVYTDEWLQEYKPYHESKIGGDINKGLERTGYIYTDIRNSEHSVDVKITYKGDTRIVRVTR